MQKRSTFIVYTVLVLLVLACAMPALALPPAPGDYDSVTGEPRCIKCHNGEKKYSIDYTREPSCFSCHGPGLSQRYIEINKKYRLEPGDVGFLPHLPAQKEGGAPAVAEATEGKKLEGPGGAETAQIVVAATTRTGAKSRKSLKATGGKRKKTKKAGHNGSALKKRKDMAYVPGGYFIMGSDDWWPKSQPEHKRYVKPFYIDKYEVTNRRYAAFVKATGHAPPSNWIGGRIPRGKENHPVTYVSWNDAEAFCRWEGKHLPTEEQWEKAARGTDGRAFPWGNRFSRKKANTPQYGYGNTMAVGSFPDGVSPYGVYDMAGNVWEWVEDWFKPYPGNKHPDENYGERFKVLRGGSWYDCTYYKCGISAPSYNRIFFNPETRNNNFGFRCAADAK